jgi:tetratricopeptide (TPR) repeat protein
LRSFSNTQHLPHTPAITCVRSFFALSRHRFGEGIDLLRSALEEDPYSDWMHARLAWALHLAGDAEGSRQQAAQALREFPESRQVAWMAALLLAHRGQAAQGVEIARDLVRCAPYFDPAMSTLAYALACAGEREQAHHILEQLEWMSRERYVMPTFTAAAHLALGDPEAAIASLARANSMRCPWVIQATKASQPIGRSLKTRPEMGWGLRTRRQLDGLLIDSSGFFEYSEVLARCCARGPW